MSAMRRTILPILLLVRTAYCQQLINLNSFGGNKTTVINATGPFALYVSASSDSDELLSQLFIQTPHNQSVSLFQLKHNQMNPTSGYLQPYRVTSKRASFVSKLSDAQMKTFRGFLYITTGRQMNSNAFYVFDVRQSETIAFDNTKQDNCTLVFLNSNSSVAPASSSVISDWVQNNQSSVFIYQGIPRNEPELSYSQIFSNPVTTTGKWKFIGNVEKFSISLPAFYMRTHKGVQFRISPGYYDVHGTQTTAQTTTGFYMKPLNSADRNVTIGILTVNTFAVDTSNKTTGANVVGQMDKDASISIAATEANGLSNGYSVTPVNQILGWSTPLVGNAVSISSTKAFSGQFFAQYYTLSDN